MLIALPNGDFHPETEDLHNQYFEALCQERVQYDDNCAKNASHPSSDANRPSDIVVAVNINVEFNLISVDCIIICFSRDLVPEYSLRSESNAVYTAPPIFVESLNGYSNRSLPRLSLHMHAKEIIPACLKSNIYIGICLPRALTSTRLVVGNVQRHDSRQNQ